MILRACACVLCLTAAMPAAAYCVHNQLAARDIVVEQEMHRERLREERIFRHTIRPGQRQCCRFHNLDCNPGGRNESIVNLTITVVGEPSYHCGFPEGADSVKVSGDGAVRVLPNPRFPKHSLPYIVRVRSQDKDITGPRGLPCPQSKPKATKGK